MAHYAFLDDNLLVTEVIVGKYENNDVDWEEYYGNIRNQVCKRTSYNTVGNQHKLSGTPFRGNYAGVGYNYDPENDIFLRDKPFNSWVLDLVNADWTAPKPYPDDEQAYRWNEDNLNWELVE